MKIRAIITGVTGMVGEGVLHECLNHPDVEKILVLVRKTSGYKHPKMTEVLHNDFMNLTPIEGQLKDYNACYFCLGVSSVGISKETYEKLTYELTMHLGETLSRLNPNMTFCYISGAGTDSTEKGKSHWARIKGKTENHLRTLPFKAAYAFRPGYMQPIKGLKFTQKYYNALSWSYPILRFLFPKYVSTLKELALGMINTSLYGSDKKVLEVKDFVTLSQK